MPKLTLNRFHIHVDIDRLPSMTLYIAYGIATLCLLAAGWFTYRNIYIPYMNTTIPEDKLTQKRDKLNVKEFEEVRSKLEAKQQGNPSKVTVDPFQTR